MFSLYYIIIMATSSDKTANALNYFRNKIPTFHGQRHKRLRANCRKRLNNISSHVEYMQNQINQLTLERDKYLAQTKAYQNIGSQFAGRLLMYKDIIKSLREFMDPYQITCAIVGSANRQLFELPFALEDGFTTKGYANPFGHDVDIVIFDSINDIITKKYDLDLVRQKIIKYMEYLNTEKSAGIFFGRHMVTDISDVTVSPNMVSIDDPIGKKYLVNIPHYNIKLTDSDGNIIVVDIIGWHPNIPLWPTGDFDVNTLKLNDNGIKCDGNFLDIISNISKKEATCLIDLKKLYNNGGQCLQQLGFFLSNRLKIMTYGYTNIVSNHLYPELVNEADEDCYITYCKPPYLAMKMNCGHKLSVMAFIMLLKNEFNYKCPLCRTAFGINFVDKKSENFRFDRPMLKFSDQPDGSDKFMPEMDLSIIGLECQEILRNFNLANKSIASVSEQQSASFPHNVQSSGIRHGRMHRWSNSYNDSDSDDDYSRHEDEYYLS